MTGRHGDPSGRRHRRRWGGPEFWVFAIPFLLACIPFAYLIIRHGLWRFW